MTKITIGITGLHSFLALGRDDGIEVPYWLKRPNKIFKVARLSVY